MTAERRRDIAAVCGLVAAAVLVFWPWLREPWKTLYSPWSDVIVQFAGWKAFMARTWAAGEGLAFWNPTYFCGTPAYANPQVLWLHPLHALFHVLPVDRAIAPTFLLYLICLGTGTHVWLRLCGLDPISAGVGALAGMLAPRLLYHVAGGFLPYLLAVALLPWAVAVTEHALRRPSAWRWALVALTLSLMLSSGFVQMWVYAGYALGLYVLARPREGWTPSPAATPQRAYARERVPPKAVALFGLAGAFAGAVVLAFYHFWPAFVFAGQTTRGGELSLADVTDVSIRGWQWMTALIPQPWGDPSRMLAAGDGRWLLWEQSLAFGLVPLLLLTAGRRSRQYTLWWFAAGLLLVCLLFAWGSGNPLFGLLYRMPGVARFRFPVRALFVAGVAGSALVATGVAAWRTRAPTHRPDLRFVCACFVASCALAAVIHWRQAEARFAPGAVRSALLACGVAGSVMVAGAWARRTRTAEWFVGLLVVLLIVDSVRSAGWAVRMEDPAIVYPMNGPIRWARRHADVNRVMDFRGVIHKGMPSRTGVLIPDGYDPLQLAHTVAFMGVLAGESEQGKGNDIRIYHVADPELFALIGARYALAQEPELPGMQARRVWSDVPTFQFWRGVGAAAGPTILYEYPRAMPRAFVVGSGRRVAPDEMRTALRTCEPHDEVLLDVEPPVAGAASYLPAEITHYGANRVSIRATSDGPGYLVFTDAWYPAWEATRNGEHTPVLRADGMFRAVALPAAGGWTIEFRYAPRAERLGALVTVCGLAGLALLGVRERYSKPGPSSSSSSSESGVRS